MKEIQVQVTDFEYDYIQQYAKQFDILINTSFFTDSPFFCRPRINNSFADLKELFFFPSNNSYEQLKEIQNKITTNEEKRINCLVKVGQNNFPSNYSFLDVALINYNENEITVDINNSYWIRTDQDLYNLHVNKKMGEILNRESLYCDEDHGHFQSLFKIDLKFICDVRFPFL